VLLATTTTTHHNHHCIEQSSQLPLNNRSIDTLTPHFLSFNNLHLEQDKSLANAFTSHLLSADTSRLRPRGLQHQQSTMMPHASPASSPMTSMSSPSYTRSRNTSFAARPQRPGPKQPPQPRDGDTRHMFNSMSASFASKGPQQPPRDPWPRDPGNGRRSRRDPQPRDPGGKRDPQPRDPGT
jgi:hypothetical protein